MGLVSRFRKIIREYLFITIRSKEECLNLLSSYANNKNKETFNFLNEHFDHKKIEDSIEQGISREAERDYKLVTRKNSSIWPDQAPDPKIFATGLLYGLLEEKYSKKDIKNQI